MRALVLLLCVKVLLVNLSVCIDVPGQNVDKKTLTTLGIKTLGWQDEDDTNSPFSQVHVHHNYSKVSVQNEGVSSFSQSQSQESQSQNKFTSQSSSFSSGQNQNTQDFSQSQVGGFGQVSVDEDEYFELTPQSQQNHQSSYAGQSHSGSQQGGSVSVQTSFAGQQKDDLAVSQILENEGLNQNQDQQNSFGGQEEDDTLEYGTSQNGDQKSKITNTNQESGSYSQGQEQNQNIFNQGQQENEDYDELSTVSSFNNRQIYNAHGYGNMLQLDKVMEAENYLQSQQQFEDFPNYDQGQLQLVDQDVEATNVEQQERQAKNFYTPNEPIYVHGFKYPPNPEDVYPLHKQTPEIYTKCPKMATGQFVHALSCNQFLNCWKGRGFVQNCAPGTLFNPKTLECDFASKVQCVTGPRKPEFEQNQQTASQKVESGCPAEFSGVVPHHTDCSKFINCANGMENVMDCPPGTLFSLKINNCDYPYRTECASWSVQFGNIKNFGENYQGKDNYNKYGQNNDYQSGTNKYDQKYGSNQNQGTGGVGYENQESQNGFAESQQNLHGYNQGSSNANKNLHGTQLQQNTFAIDQSSTGSQSGTGYHQQSSQGSSQSSYGGHGNVDQYSQGSYGQNQQSGQNFHGSYSQNAGSRQNNIGQQPSSGTNKNIHGVNSQSSGSFGQGANLNGQSQSFYGQNQDLLGSQSQYVHGNQNQGQYLNGNQNLHGQNSYGQNQNFETQSQHKLQGQNQGQYLNGNQNLHGQNTYGQNQNFETQGQSQSSYGNSQGVESQGQYLHGIQTHHGQYENVGSQSENQNQNVDSSGSNKFSTGQKYGSAKCPDGSSGLFPHPSDCAKFLNCANGQTFVQDCGPGTVFNPELKVCDFPYRVNCHHSDDYHELINVRAQPKPTINQHGQITSTHGQYINNQGSTSQSYGNGGESSVVQWQTGQNADGSASGIYQQTLDKQNQNYHSSSGTQKPTISGGKIVVKCPEHGSGLYPHPSICSKFLNCANGQTFIQDCGPGTVFNPTSKVCDFPYNVECGATHGEGLIDIKRIPVATEDEAEGTQTYGNSETIHGQQTFHGSNQNVDETQQGSYGQEQSTNFNQQGFHGQNQNVDGGSTSKTQQGFYEQGESTNVNQHQGFNGQNQNGQGSGTTTSKTQQGSGQGKTTNLNEQGFYGHNQNVDGATQQGFYGQGESTNVNQHQGFYGQNQNVQGSGTSTSKTQQGSGQGKTTTLNQQGFYGHNQNVDDTSTGKPQQGFYGHGQTSGWNSNSQNQQNSFSESTTKDQQGFYGQGSNVNEQQGSYGQGQQAGSGWGNKTQQGFYGQNQFTTDDQELQETRNNYGQQQFSGSIQGQHINKINQQGQSHSQLGSQNNLGGYHKPHSPPPFPSTDINADYEFGNEGATLEVGALGQPKPNVPKVHLKDNRKRKDFCEPLDFHCTVDDCIPQSMVCDDVKDCPNGLDEQNCEKYLKEFTLTPNTILAVREKERYLNITLVYCAKSCLESKGFQCKSFSYRKDDGACFLSDTNVGNSGALIISHPYNYYEVSAYTVDCSKLYKCPSQKCLNFKQVCDGINDCGDRTDEKGCSAEAFGYQIKLGGSDKKHEGRIELKAFGKWGYVCDDKFGLRDADVACRELGFPLGSLEVKANSYYAHDVNEEDVFYMMDDVACLGNETSLRDCDFNGWGVNNCENQEIVGIVCKTPLANCPKDHWKCDSSQECVPFAFVCDGVFDCTDQSDEGDHCEAPTELRLANGKSKYEGRLEIRYHGIWGTVCDDDFNDDSAKVVCKHLGYPGRATAKKDGFFGAGSGPIWLDQVFCQGNESALEHCVHWNWGEHNCEHAEDVGIICSNTYDNIGNERNVKVEQRYNIDALPENLFPERCGLRKDDQFLEDDEVHFRVVKGSIATKGDYPWQASLRIKNKSKPSHWCGAVVISQKFILTAAHCLDGFSKGAYFVVAGDYNTDDAEGTEQEAYIDEFYIHEKFRDGQKMNNDIAVVKLKGQGFTFTKDVQPICLPEADLVYEKGLNCTISGFGSIQSGKSGYSHQLRAGWVPMQSRAICQMPHVYGSAITEGMICAGSLDEGVDACDGDSGGPLACLHDGLFTLYGLTSWGHQCSHANKPGVYVKVSHYRDWIDQTIKKHS